MTIRICCVGRLKERYWRDAAAEYQKRLGRYAKVEIIEVMDESTIEAPSDREREQILAREADRLLAKISSSEYCIALAIDGRSFSSESFAGYLDQKMTGGASRICFVIGGSLGLGRAVLDRAQEKISFSQMTFPHQLMRVILLEQVYRGFRIMRGEPYHK
ncbi:MAG: 23S rRNA (pseudouridine(1915)-N(3))-methyltransferase RlmH [Lachnospiraceae bacterium]|nr:23S rRNA (pseudouridine(1915)-N(3))-methyltransferase RlmH [Lachnospiraceae bacterium]